MTGFTDDGMGPVVSGYLSGQMRIRRGGIFIPELGIFSWMTKHKFGIFLLGIIGSFVFLIVFLLFNSSSLCLLSFFSSSTSSTDFSVSTWSLLYNGCWEPGSTGHIG